VRELAFGWRERGRCWKCWSGHYFDVKRRSVGIVPLQERNGHIVDGNPALRPAFRVAVMSMAVKDGVDRKTPQRLFQPAAAQERINLQGLPLDSFRDGRVME
jgi:hypothetical protein